MISGARSFAALLLFLFLTPQSLLSQVTAAQSEKRPVVLFALWPAKEGTRPPQPIIDAIAILNLNTDSIHDRYQAPPDLWNDALFKAFDTKYLSPGTTYAAYFGGSRLGSITTKQSADFDCASYSATVALNANQSFAYPEMGLVSSSPIFREHTNHRRAATQAEKAEVTKLAQHWFARFGLDLRLLPKLKIENIVATAIDITERPVLIASVSVLAPAARHHLFLIAEPNAGGKYEIILPQYHEMQDLQDGTDSQFEQFVDQLDLDGDGIDEIVSMTTYYESRDYRIYKRQENGWVTVFSGGGGGC